MTTTPSSSASQLADATTGYSFLFSNSLSEAQTIFRSSDSPFHLAGLGICAFLEAALGLEQDKIDEAMKALTLAEASSRKLAKSSSSGGRFTPGMEMEVLNADAVVLLGVTHALSESYVGYLQCMYSLNSAHSKFTKLYKTVFPNGLDGYRTPATTPSLSPNPSSPSFQQQPQPQSSFFGRWLSAPSSPTPAAVVPEGPVDELILSGTAFGFGLFNLVLSLLPKRVQNLVGFFGFKHDRDLGLRALSVSAAFGPGDIHAVFAGLVLMTYHGTLLLLSGWQADESHILKQYTSILDRLESHYPSGTLWTLHRAKILRLSGSPTASISVLTNALSNPSPEPNRFIQADTLLLFDLSWVLLSTRSFIEAGETFLKIISINSWSRATYLYVAAGCFFSGGDLSKAEELVGEIERGGWVGRNARKVGGREVGTEVVVRKKLEYYRQRQQPGSSSWISTVKISFVDEMGIFWNLHTRLTPPIASAYISQWNSLPPETLQPDDLALQNLLMGITYRSLNDWENSKAALILSQSLASQLVVSSWIPGWAGVEYAVTLLHEASSASEGVDWESVLKEVEEVLDHAMEVSPRQVEMSSRLGGRVGMVRGEIEKWRSMRRTE